MTEQSVEFRNTSLVGERLARIETNIEHILKSQKDLTRMVETKFEKIDDAIDLVAEAQRKHEQEDFVEFKELKKKSKWKMIELLIGFAFGIVGAFVMYMLSVTT